jgi:hypothetical protein
MSIIQEEMKGPILALGYYKPSNGLVRSLIDGASKVFCIPLETYLTDRLVPGTFLAE